MSKKNALIMKSTLENILLSQGGVKISSDSLWELRIRLLDTGLIVPSLLFYKNSEFLKERYFERVKKYLDAGIAPLLIFAKTSTIYNGGSFKYANKNKSIMYNYLCRKNLPNRINIINHKERRLELFEPEKNKISIELKKKEIPSSARISIFKYNDIIIPKIVPIPIDEQLKCSQNLTDNTVEKKQFNLL